jgi:hypothetical protein
MLNLSENLTLSLLITTTFRAQLFDRRMSGTDLLSFNGAGPVAAVLWTQPGVLSFKSVATVDRKRWIPAIHHLRGITHHRITPPYQSPRSLLTLRLTVSYEEIIRGIAF